MEAGVTQIMNDRSHAHPSPSHRFHRGGRDRKGPDPTHDGWDGGVMLRVAMSLGPRAGWKQ